MAASGARHQPPGPGAVDFRRILRLQYRPVRTRMQRENEAVLWPVSPAAALKEYLAIPVFRPLIIIGLTFGSICELQNDTARLSGRAYGKVF